MTIPTFPVLPLVNFPLTRTMLTSTAKEQSESGQTFRYAKRSRPKWQWQLGIDGLRELAYAGVSGEWTALQTFLLSVLGPAAPFYYLDSLDNTVSTPAQIGTGDGFTTTFQIGRYFGPFFEPLYGAVGGSISNGALAGSPSLYVAGTLQAGGSYTIGPTGLVTFTSAAPASGAAVTWKGAFTFLCEFDDDAFEQQMIFNGLYAVGKLSFTSKLL